MKRKHISLLLLLAILTGSISAWAEEPKKTWFNGGHYSGFDVETTGDTVITVAINPIYIVSPHKNKKAYERLIRNVKKVYPYAIEARQYMHNLEEQLARIDSPRERDKFTSQMEREIARKYTPVLENMSFTQGKILIKLIDRETERTPYAILRQFRGRFTAGFYNTIAKIFKANLKEHYDPTEGEDAIIEHILLKIEAGLL